MLLFILFFLIMPAYSATLNISDVTEAAQRTRPALKALSQNISASEHLEKKAFAGYLPHFSATHTSQTIQQHSTLHTSAHTLSLQGTQLLYNPAGPQLQTKIAEKTTERARHIFNNSAHKVRQEVTALFLDAWLLQEKKTLIDTLQQLADETEKNAQTEHGLQKINVQEYTRIIAEVAAYRATIRSYEYELNTAHEALHTSIGLSTSIPTTSIPTTSLDHTITPLPKLHVLNEYIEWGYKSRPEVKEKNSAIAQQGLTSRSHRTQYLPSFQLSGSVGKTFAGSTSLQGTNATASISVQWNFFDGLQSYHAAQASDAEKLRIEFELQELRNSIRREITAAYQAVQSSNEQYDAAVKLTTAYQHIFEEKKLLFAGESINRNVFLHEQYEYEKASHALKSAYVTMRKQYESLLYFSGYNTEE